MNTYQDGLNGSLKPLVRRRIRTVRDELGFTWNEVGDAFDFSATFMHGLSREEVPLRIKSKHLEKLIRDLEALEVRAGLRDASEDADGENGASPAVVNELSLEQLIRAITDKGFNVTFSPVQR